MKKTEIKKVNRFKICVGLNDSDSDLQKYETEKYISIVEFVCKNMKTAFSLDVIRGGYNSFEGRFTRENSIAITLIDITQEQADEIASELCAMFHQESVLVMRDTVDAYFIMDRI